MTYKRREKRFEEKNKAVIHLLLDGKDSGEHLVINALTHDISLGGARILTKKSFPVGTALRVQIDLSGSGQVIKVDAEVKWVERMDNRGTFAMGVEFLHEISKTVLTLIAHLYGTDEGVPTAISNSEDE